MPPGFLLFHALDPPTQAPLAGHRLKRLQLPPGAPVSRTAVPPRWSLERDAKQPTVLPGPRQMVSPHRWSRSPTQVIWEGKSEAFMEEAI